MLRKFIGFLTLLTLTACSAKMPLEEGRFVNTPDQGLGILVVTTVNNHSSPGLTPTEIVFKSTSGKVKKGYKFPEAVRELGEKSYRFIASVQLPADDYYITAFNGVTDLHFGALLPTRGQFNPEVNFPVTLRAGEYSYLGHLTARLVEKTSSSEERAGPLLPLLDQAATGMSDGTFKFDIKDNLSEDLPLITEKYPSIRSVNLGKSLISLDGIHHSQTPTSLAMIEEASPTATANDSETGRFSNVKETNAKLSANSCSIKQILSMKEMGMSDQQVHAACKE